MSGHCSGRVSLIPKAVGPKTLEIKQDFEKMWCEVESLFRPAEIFIFGILGGRNPESSDLSGWRERERQRNRGKRGSQRAR